MLKSGPLTSTASSGISSDGKITFWCGSADIFFFLFIRVCTSKCITIKQKLHYLLRRVDDQLFIFIFTFKTNPHSSNVITLIHLFPFERENIVTFSRISISVFLLGFNFLATFLIYIYNHKCPQLILQQATRGLSSSSTSPLETLPPAVSRWVCFKHYFYSFSFSFSRVSSPSLSDSGLMMIDLELFDDITPKCVSFCGRE